MDQFAILPSGTIIDVSDISHIEKSIHLDD